MDGVVFESGQHEPAVRTPIQADHLAAEPVLFVDSERLDRFEDARRVEHSNHLLTPNAHVHSILAVLYTLHITVHLEAVYHSSTYHVQTHDLITLAHHYQYLPVFTYLH